jgi:hypothetical protein
MGQKTYGLKDRESASTLPGTQANCEVGSIEFNLQRPTASSSRCDARRHAMAVPDPAGGTGSSCVRHCCEGPHHNQQHRLDEDEMKARHWFTRTGLTNGRHAKRHTTPTNTNTDWMTTK